MDDNDFEGKTIMWKRLTLEGEIVEVQAWGEVTHRVEVEKLYKCEMKSHMSRIEKVKHHINEEKTNKLSLKVLG